MIFALPMVLVCLGGLIAFDRIPSMRLGLHHPLVIGTVMGYISGQVEHGVIIGLLLEVMYIIHAVDEDATQHTADIDYSFLTYCVTYGTLFSNRVDIVSISITFAFAYALMQILLFFDKRLIEFNDYLVLTYPMKYRTHVGIGMLEHFLRGALGYSLLSAVAGYLLLFFTGGFRVNLTLDDYVLYFSAFLLFGIIIGSLSIKPAIKYGVFFVGLTVGLFII